MALLKSLHAHTYNTYTFRFNLVDPFFYFQCDLVQSLKGMHTEKFWALLENILHAQVVMSLLNTVAGHRQTMQQTLDGYASVNPFN